MAESAERVPVAWQHCPGLADTAQGSLQGRAPLGESGLMRCPCHPDPQAVLGMGVGYTHQVVWLLLGSQMLTRNECFSGSPAELCVQLFNFQADNNQPLAVFTFSIEVQRLGAAAGKKPLSISVTPLAVPPQKPWKVKATGGPWLS